MLKTSYYIGKCWVLMLLMFLAVSCQSYRPPQRQANHLPIIPSYIHEPKEQLKYYLTHYWDYIDFKDSTFVNKDSRLDTLLWDYLGLLDYVDNPTKEQILYPLERLEGASLIKALAYYKQHLYEEPISVEAEDLYREVALWASQSPQVPIEYQTGAKELLRLLQRSRVGAQASDFVYTNDSTTLRLLPIREPYRLLIFSRGGDSTYIDVERYIQREAVYERMVKSKQLSIQVVYTQCEAEQAKRFLATDTLQPQWIERTIDSGDSIIQYRLYDLKDKLTLYLVTQQGKIALKAPKLNQLTEYLKRNEK